jgi:hypothetical protein
LSWNSRSVAHDVGVGRDMGLVAVDRLAGAVAGPGSLLIGPARGGDHRRVDQRAGLHCHRPRVQLLGHQCEQARVEAMLDEGAAERTKAVRSGVGSNREKPRDTSERRLIIERVGELHIRQVMPDRDRAVLHRRARRSRVGMRQMRPPEYGLQLLPQSVLREVSGGGVAGLDGRACRIPAAGRVFSRVFTLPAPIADIAFQNKAAVYGLLFHASAQTLLTIAAEGR